MVTTWLPIALLVALVPCLPLKQISTASLDQARDYWLLGMLALATIWLATVALPLAPIGIWALVHWRDRHTLETMGSWVGIAGFWFACRALPAEAWPWITGAWTVTGTVAVGALVWQWVQIGRDPRLNAGRPWYHPLRTFHSAGWFGQRILAGAFLALTLPFFPVWALPIPLVGLWVTSSWTAAVAVLGAAFVLWPMSTLVLGGGSLALGAAALRWMPILGGQRLLEWTPRGDSLDSVRQRVRVGRLILGSFARREWWPWGYGSRVGPKPAMEYGIIRWATIHGPDRVPTGHAHLDFGHMLFEYGLPGVTSVLLLLILVVPRLQLGDPYSACFIAGAILSLGTLAFRYPGTGLVWLAATVHLLSR